MVLHCVVVVVRFCRLRVVPWHPWERWQGGQWGRWPVGCVRWVACGGRLRWGVLVMELVGVAVVFTHQGEGFWGGGGMLMVLVVPRSLALREWRSVCGVDLCG